MANKTIDDILNDILTAATNANPDADISKGSMLFIKSSGYAAALWGLQQHQNYIKDQIFPDTSDTDNLDHHAYIRGLSRKTDEINSSLAARVVDYIRQPPSGGNQHDYVKWAVEIDGVANAWVIPLAQGPGSLDLVVMADATVTGSEIPTPELLATVRAHIVDQAPNDVMFLRVVAPTVITQDVTVTRTNAALAASLAVGAIQSYMSALLPGAPLYRSQLATLALGGLDGDAAVTVPAANVTPQPYELIRPGTVEVTP